MGIVSRVVAGAVAVALGVLLAAPAPSAVAATKVPGSFVVRGSGAGHGVGMSQYGAYQLSRAGDSASDIISFYYPGAAVATATNNPRTIKVQVLGPTPDDRKKATLTVSGRFTLTDGSGTAVGSFTAGKATLKVSGSKVAATIGKKTVKAARLVIATSGVATLSGAQGSYHAGTLQATVIGKRLNVVNQVAMNTDYLYGLDEMPASWGTAGGAAALQAQAIVARSWVITQILSHLDPSEQPADAGRAACDCHVYDDQRSQNYTGWKKAGKKANQPWLDAVDATVHGTTVDVVRPAGSPGEIAETPYFASTGWASGAGTGSNADVFGTASISYLSGVVDPYSAQAPANPYRSWKRTLSQAKVAKLFGVEKVVSIQILTTYEGGLVESLTATTASGATKTLTKTSAAWTSALGVPAPWLTSITAK
ncbi:MAG: SpoIID/LytB domain-containing protein [Propionicimonas sp.]|uniref:SpoIID/LytB domain-containing protein n=1 Tax=Propionicimonas sp. TaxID=1955623 RepID=UPI003D0BFEA3